MPCEVIIRLPLRVEDMQKKDVPLVIEVDVYRLLVCGMDK